MSLSLMIGFHVLFYGTSSFTSAGVPEEAVFQASPVTADHPELQTIGERLQAIRVLRAEFKQQKNIKALRRPLKSSGQFLFATQHGVWWHTVRPFETTFVMTPDGIYQQGEGVKPLKIEVAEQPVIGSFTQVFLSLFAGNTEILDRRFQIFFTQEGEDWVLGLKPRGTVLKKLVDRIVLQGKAHMHTLDFIETSGDRTRISFENTRTEPETLSEAERARFTF